MPGFIIAVRRRTSSGNVPRSLTVGIEAAPGRSARASPNTRLPRRSKSMRAPGAPNSTSPLSAPATLLRVMTTAFRSRIHRRTRRIETGDSVVMEITPCLEGYWTQLVRTVNVGTPNPELEKLYRVARDAIKRGLEVFRPGKTVRDVALAIIGYVESCGLSPQTPVRPYLRRRPE